MKRPSAACPPLRYVVPALALVYLMLPDRTYVDAGLAHLAGNSAGEQRDADWKPVQMHTLSDIGIVPVAAQWNANAVLSGGADGGARPVYRSFVPDKSGLDEGLPPPVRRSTAPVADTPGLLDFSEEADDAQIDFRKRGWLAESVLAAERDAETLSTRMFSDLAGALNTDVFGRNDRMFGSPVESRSGFGPEPFEAEDANDDFLVQRPGMLDDADPSSTDSGLFSVGRNPR